MTVWESSYAIISVKRVTNKTLQFSTDIRSDELVVDSDINFPSLVNMVLDTSSHLSRIDSSSVCKSGNYLSVKFSLVQQWNE